MATHVFPVLCILLAVGHLSAGNLVFDAKPDIISPGLTSDLTVNCSFIYNNQSSISNIVSLVISKADSQNSQPDSFIDVLSINAFTNHVIGKDSANGAVTSGNIDSNTLDAFLSLSWSSPSQAESGFYRCDANVMDDFGHPVDISKSAEVTYSGPDLNALKGIVETLQADLASVKSKVDNEIQRNAALTSTIAAQNSTIADKTAEIAALEEQLKNKSETTDLQTTPDKLVLLLQQALTKSPTYNGHFYLISYPLSVVNFDLSEYFCNINHGYLAEIDNELEYHFVVNFTQSLSWRSGYLVGAIKDASGQWVFRHSGRPVAYFDWYNGEGPPSYSHQHCMDLTPSGMGYISCDGGAGYIPFLCEVPES